MMIGEKVTEYIGDPTMWKCELRAKDEDHLRRLVYSFEKMESKKPRYEFVEDKEHFYLIAYLDPEQMDAVLKYGYSISFPAQDMSQK